MAPEHFPAELHMLWKHASNFYRLGSTIFFQINTLGIYNIFMILGRVIGEGCLFKRNRILTIGSFLFSLFLNYNSISMRSSSESLESLKLLFLFASSVSLFAISKGLLLRYYAFSSRFCCSFNISKPLAQG